MASTTTVPTVKRHPIRGAIWGLFMGIGAALILIGQAIVALGTLTPYVVVLVFVVLGVGWGLFGPAKGPRGDEPVIQQPGPPPGEPANPGGSGATGATPPPGPPPGGSSEA